MQFNTELDTLIEKYKSDLVKLWAQYGSETDTFSENTGNPDGEASKLTQEAEQNGQDDKQEQTDSSDGNLYVRQDFSQMPESVSEETETAREEKPASPYPLANPESYATFKAVVLSAGGAFPVPDARVSLKRKGALQAFLLTNGSGETKTVKIEAYPEENSLEPLNPDKQMLYTADINADGFEDKRDLPVYATGGSDIILQQYLVPTGGK